MSKLDLLKEKLMARKPVLMTTIANVSWSGLAQKAAGFGFDAMIYDLEHGTLSVVSVEEQLRLCRLCDLPTIVRIPDCVPNLVSKVLDMGADGLLLPRVESLQQVEIAIRAARFYPRGRKGFGGFSCLRADDQGNVERANDRRLIFVQIESLEGLEVLPQILEKYKEELAGVLIGPYDASIMVGTPLNITSDVMIKFIKDVFDVCHQYEVSCGSFTDNGPMISHYRNLGANVYWVGTETTLIGEAYSSVAEKFRAETMTD